MEVYLISKLLNYYVVDSTLIAASLRHSHLEGKGRRTPENA